MNLDTTRLTYSLNSVDNSVSDLARSIESLKSGQAQCATDVAALQETLGHARLKVEQTANQTRAIWGEFLDVLDKVAAMKDCPKAVWDLLQEALSHLGYSAYGLAGENVHSVSDVDVITWYPETKVELGTILRTVTVGLRRPDGSVARKAQVIACGAASDSTGKEALR